MISRVFDLFRRYASHHAHLQKPGFPLIVGSGAQVGQVDNVSFRAGRLWIDGRVDADHVGLASRFHVVECIPPLPGQEAPQGVTEAKPGPRPFALDFPLNEERSLLWAEIDGVCHIWPIPSVTPADLRTMRRAQILPFLRDMARAFPAGVTWALRRDALSVARVKTALGLNIVSRSRQLNTRLFASDTSPETDRSADLSGVGITMVVPVYNAFDLLPEMLSRVLQHTDMDWRLVLVEDCSTDARVRPFLREKLASLPRDTAARVTLIENERNLGFIGAVNRGLEVAVPFGNHVVLLNSDALVPEGWASRLVRPLVVQPDVATVTPMSNDAEIFNIPAICRRVDLQPGEADAIDRVATTFLPEAACAEAPTGVGFCMAMNIAFLRRITSLDSAFGRGYGEEVDWCQRARQANGRHLGHGGLFVEHRGGTSFGSVEKQRLVQNNGRIISRRYPDYDAEVQAFIHDDPLNTPRLALGLAWAGLRQGGAMPVYIAHDMGGGAEFYLQERLKADLAENAAAIVVRVGGLSRWQVELHSTNGVTTGETNSTDFLLRLMNLLPARRIVYSCAVGDRDPVALPEILLSMVRDPDDRIEVLFHDYLPLSPSYTLLTSKGTYEGVPMPGTTQDPAHKARRPDGTEADLAQWRAEWGKLLMAADQIIVFSEDSRSIVAKAYPHLAAGIKVVPHRMRHKIPRVDPPVTCARPPVIGVLGNIGHQKGIAVLADLSRQLARNGRARLVILGNTDPAYPLAPSATVHGAYQIDEIPALAARYGISRWLIPSIWPETFSYTTHEALATGLPVFSFDLGAQGDAVRAASASTGRGGTLPLRAPDCDTLLDLMLGDLGADKGMDQGADRGRAASDLPPVNQLQRQTSPW